MKCCARHANGGKCCGAHEGQLFACGLDDPTTGHRCAYALCELHCRTPRLIDALLAEGLCNARFVADSGSLWLIAVGVLAAADALYTPVLRTALLLLACHPRYQCEFDSCSVGVDQAYTVVFSLSLVTVVVFGMGYPLGLFVILRKRVRMVVACGAQTHEAGHRDAEHRTRTSVSQPKVDWRGMAASDPSVLASLYKPLQLQWIYLSPILLAWKVVLLGPIVFLPPATIEQNVGIATVQVAYALFIVATSPFTNPVMNAMFRLGSLHQLAFLALQNFDVLARYEGGEAAGYGLGLISLTAVYLAICGCCVLWLSLGKIVLEHRRNTKIARALAAVGKQSISSTRLYEDPIAQRAAAGARLRAALCNKRMRGENSTPHCRGDGNAPPSPNSVGFDGNPCGDGHGSHVAEDCRASPTQMADCPVDPSTTVMGSTTA